MISESNSTKRIPEALVDALLPGAGYFGSTPDTCLKVEIGGVIDSIEVSIEAPAPEILNIGEISFENENGETIPREEICARIEMSSTFGDAPLEKCFGDFLAGRLLHSKLEPRPSIRILMKEPTAIWRLAIKNRSDIYGARSRHLVVRASSGRHLVIEHQNFNYDKAKRDAARILIGLGILDIPALDKEMPAFVRTVRRKISKKIDANALNVASPQIYQLLPLINPNDAPTGYSLSICAHIILSEGKGRAYGQTRDLRKFGLVLHSDLRVEQLCREIERLMRIRTGESRTVTISRHSIHEARLINSKDAFLSGLKRAVGVLSDAGVSAMLGYGTLLGAVRSGAFLPHDDDVDLIYFDGSRTESECRAGRQKVIEILAKHGIRATPSRFSHLHATVEPGIVVDLFPVWQEGKNAYLAMEQLRIRAVPIGHLLPTSTVYLHGHAFPAPGNSEAFLLDRYGEGWREPDPYFEWPWRIERILTRVPQEVRASFERRARQSRRHWGRLCRVACGQRVIRDGASPPKNCLDIIKVARETGYDAVELDIRMSADGVPVLAHDDRLSGPDGEITVSKSSAAALVKFKLGTFDESSVFIPTLETALIHASGMDVQLDARIRAEQVPRLREAVERANYDPTRLQFCVYDAAQARAYLAYFPESVLLWKTYRPFAEVDEYFLDDAKALGLDGVMLMVPSRGDELSEFMRAARGRGLRALFFIHSGGDALLKDMVQHGVDYVMTIANQSSIFKRVEGGLRWLCD